MDGVSDKLRGLAKLHDERQGLYGFDYLKVGSSLAGMFPEGITLNGPEDFTRFALLIHAHGKLLRYSSRFHDGGHEDSLDDLSVYSQLLSHADEVLG